MSSMFKYRNISIRYILTFFFIITLSLPILIQLFANKLVLDSYKDELILSDTYKVTDYKNKIDYYLTDIINLSSMIYGNNDYTKILTKETDVSQLENLKDSQLMRAYFQQFLYRDHIRGVYIYTTTGQYYAANSNFGFINLDESLTKGQWVKSLINHDDDLFFLPAHKPAQLTDGFPVFSLVRKIKNPNNGDYIGLMIIDINPLIYSPTNNTSPATSSTFFIADQNQQIIYHSNPDITIQKLEPLYHKDLLVNTTENFILQDGTDNALVTYTSSKIGHWNIYIETPLKTLEKDAITINRFILIATLLTYVLAIGISVYFSKQISTPISQITTYMRDVESGRFETHPPLENNREIYTLSTGYNSMTNRIKYHLQNEVQMKLLKKEADFKTLQAQINPHFLYNTLESISSMADMNKNSEISRTCIILSNMFRYSIGVKKDVVPLRYEIKHVQNYISIMQLRYEYDLNLELQVDPIHYSYGLFKLTLQPIVENCIQHAFNDTRKNARIVLSSYESDGTLLIEIEDNGCGIKKDRLNQLLMNIQYMPIDNHTTNSNQYSMDKIWGESKHSSIGLANIHSRYSLLYGADYGIIRIENVDPHGTKVTLAIPKESLKETTHV